MLQETIQEMKSECRPERSDASGSSTRNAGPGGGIKSAADLVAEGGFESEVLGLSSLVLLRVNGNRMHAGSERKRRAKQTEERERQAQEGEWSRQVRGVGIDEADNKISA